MTGRDRTGVEEAERACADWLLDFCRAAPADVAGRIGLAFEDEQGLTAVRTASYDLPPLNRVLCLGVGHPLRRERLQAVVANYITSDRPSLIGLTPVCRPADLPDWLAEAGCEPGARTAVLSHGLGALPTSQTEFRVRRIGREHADAFARLVTELSGLPKFFVPWLGAAVGRAGWHHYLAFSDGGDSHGAGAAVAAGALFIRGDEGLLGWAVTAPRFRGRGAQSALIRRRLEEARAAGCRCVYVDTDAPANGGAGGPSFRNLVRLGFTPVFTRVEYVPVRTGAGASANAHTV